MTRAGFGGTAEHLAALSSHIDKLQKSPGRLVQTLDKASYDVWNSGGSGVGGGDKTISYYVKGPVVGFMLDAKIRKATGGKKSLDDHMKLAYQRHAGERGFTADNSARRPRTWPGLTSRSGSAKCYRRRMNCDYTEALDWSGCVSRRRTASKVPRAGGSNRGRMQPKYRSGNCRR